MYDDSDITSWLVVSVGLFVIFVLGCVIGIAMNEPNKLKDKNCIIYHHEIYCKEED